VRSTGYVHALGWQALNRLYDPLVRVTIPERRFKRALIAAARLRAGDRLLDLGCGTGTLLIMTRRSIADVIVVGIDGDLGILQIARRKARRAGVRVPVAGALATSLPFATGSFDRVLTTLVLHHLDRAGKLVALREGWRVLRAGGELHMADFGRPHTALMRIAAKTIGRFGGHPTTIDNVEGRLPELCAEAGFQDAFETERWRTVFGTLSFYRAHKPL
jgi:ubiquinone/menaquinone biosynthesis C-methylase UbiE